MTESSFTTAGAAESLSPQALDVLVMAAQNGDREKFRMVLLATQSEVRLAIAWRTRDHHLVDEILQQTYVIAFQRLASYHPHGTFRAWLKGIARIQATKEKIAQRRHVSLDEALAISIPDHDQETETDDRTIAALRDCLALLAPRARKLIERRYMDETPLAELARQFKQKTNTLAVTLMRIRTSLSACLHSKELNT